MKIQITARHFKAKESTQNYIKEKLEELEKYNELIISAEIILSYDKPPLDLKYCEIILKLKEKIIATKESGTDFDRAIDAAVIKAEKQLYKIKDKHKTLKYSKPNID